MSLDTVRRCKWSCKADPSSVGFFRWFQCQLYFVFWPFRDRLFCFCLVGEAFCRVWVTAQVCVVGYGSSNNFCTFRYFARIITSDKSTPTAFDCRQTRPSQSPTLMVLRTLLVPIETTKVVYTSNLVPGDAPSRSVLANNERIELRKFVHFASYQHWLFQLLITPLDRPGSGWLVVV